MPTDQILDNTNLVVEGEVISTNCIKYNEEIFTENVLLIKHVLSGDNDSRVLTILTIGGEIDGVTQFQSHGFALRKGDKGFSF